MEKEWLLTHLCSGAVGLLLASGLLFSLIENPAPAFWLDIVFPLLCAIAAFWIAALAALRRDWKLFVLGESLLVLAMLFIWVLVR